jgi:hydrocephalus-inducing protein
MCVTNTSAIPLPYSWHFAEDVPAAREFVCLPAKGTILPYGSQAVSLEFCPQSVQHYDLTLVMDMPGISDSAMLLPVKAECAVPLVVLDKGVLEFGECFLGYPYHSTFKLLNESKLPAKYEVLQQVKAPQ